jgi:hypothetical protein
MNDLASQTTHPLVAAALAHTDVESLEAWNRWNKDVDFNLMPYEELVILPSLYQRLKDLPDFAGNERLPGIARKFFYQNSLLRKELSDFRHQLSLEGHSCTVIGDEFISRITGQDHHVTETLEVFIDRDAAHIGLAILQQAGWELKALRRTGLTLVKNGFNFHLTCRLLKHWNSNTHELLLKASRHPGTEVLFAMALILLQRFRDGKWLDLRSAIDFPLLLRRTPPGTDHLRFLRDFGLEGRFLMASGHNPRSADPLAHLEQRYQVMLRESNPMNTWNYHRARFRLPATGSSFYRYWREHRQEIRTTDIWMRELQSQGIKR